MSIIHRTSLKIALTALMTLPIPFGCTPALMHAAMTLAGSRASFANVQAWECQEVVKPSSGGALAQGVMEKCGKCANVSQEHQSVQLGKETFSLPPGSIVTQCSSKAYVEGLAQEKSR